MAVYINPFSLQFLDKELENKYTKNNIEFQLKGFKILLITMGLLSTYTVVVNPHNTNTLQWIILFPVLMILGLIIYYFIVTRLIKRKIECAIILLTALIIISPTESSKKLNWSTLSLFYYYCTMQMVISIPIFVRITWRKSFFTIVFFEVYFSCRNINLNDSLNNRIYSIVAITVNVLVLWGFSYYCEKNSRIDFYEKHLWTKSIEIFKDIFKNVIPQSALIIKNSKIIFHNKATEKLFEANEAENIIETLKYVMINHQDGMDDMVNREMKLANPDQYSESSFENSDSLWTALQNSKLQGKLNEFNFYCGYMDIILNDNTRKPLDIQIGKILWEKEESIFLLISDVSAAKRLKYLKEIGEYKDKLLATVSHDLRTPLNGIMGMMTLVRERVINDEISQNFLKVSINSSKLLLYMINDILDFSQISNGKLRLYFKHFDVPNLVTEVYELILLQASNKNLSLTIENKIVDTNFRKAYIDGNRLKQVLLNLLSNALKFTSKGFIKIKLKSDDEKIYVSVHDSGIGIKPDDIPKLFKLFGKLEQIDKESANETGVGLGLAVSQTLVKMLSNNRGEISVKSNYGVGSKFSFPVFYENDSEEKLGVEREFSSSLPEFLRNSNNLSFKNNFVGNPPRRFNVLVVDDDQINLLVEVNYLRSFGNYDFKTVNNGKEALELIMLTASSAEPTFDVILMDCNMPIMDGYQASRQIKSCVERGELKYVTIIAVSANISESDRYKCKENGMDYFISKPIEKNELKEMLEKVCDKHLNE